MLTGERRLDVLADDAFRLACLCSSAAFDRAVEAEIRLLSHRVDVGHFAWLVNERHRIGPLVHAMLKRLSPDAVPPALRAALVQPARDNAIRSLQAQRTLVELARRFRQAGIAWLPFKGATLALRYYAQAGQRHVNDMDVWVRETDLPGADKVLRGLGYVRVDGELHADLAARGARHAAYLGLYYHEAQYCSPVHGRLELHWRLTDNPHQLRISPEAMLARGATLEVGGERLPVMADDDLLLYLCEHGSRHGWGRLKWLVDLPRIIDSRTWDWSALFERARQSGAWPALRLALALCEALLGWEPPPEVRKALSSWRLRGPAVRLALGFLSAPMEKSSQPFQEVAALVTREVALALLLTNTPRAMVHQASHYLLSPNDLRVVALPDRWFNLYYVLRPFLLIVRRMRPAP